MEAYHSSNDKRIEVCNVHSEGNCCIYTPQWLNNDFLGYLHEWESQVGMQRDLSKSEKSKLLLSKETRDGLKITGKICNQHTVSIIIIVSSCFY